MLATVLANGTMDENWALFAARISGRVPTENEARLLEASRRLWPAALGIAANRAAEIPGLPSDPKSIAAEIWEEALFSTLRTMDKLGTAKIADLDSYLFAIFSYRLNRYLARERKRQAIIDRFSRHDDLNGLNGPRDESSVEKIESGILLQEALALAEDWFRAMAWCYCHDFSWEQIGILFGLTSEQARKRFEYGIRKLRKWFRKPPEGGPEPT